jgi:drug/metabolite transporter (DMT)-like permease
MFAEYAMYLAALLLAVAGSIVYHLSIKQVPAGVNPFLSLAISYGLAMLVCLVALPWVPGSRQLAAVDWSSAGVALGILGIELGFLLAYRAGWSMGVAGLSSTVLSTVLLLPLGYWLFRETQSWPRLAGAGLSLTGLWLMLQK